MHAATAPDTAPTRVDMAAGRARRERPIRLALLACWAAAALFLAIRHVVWRDEVRALSFALGGDTVAAMLRGVHGDGHPALWFLMLRGAHAIWPQPAVLLVVAFAAGAATAALFALRAPLAWPWIALALAGRPLLYEYAVMARNYGIGVLAMFGFAAVYRRGRETGWLPGAMLALLANTNVVALAIAWALWSFWAIDHGCRARPRTIAAWRGPGVGLLMLAIGTALCLAVVYPPVTYAGPLAAAAAPWPLALAQTLFLNDGGLAALVPQPVRTATAGWLVPLLLAGTLTAWWRRPALLVAAVLGLGGMLAQFTFFYEPSYRHQALAAVLLLTLAWLAAEGAGGRWPGARKQEPGRWPARIGAVSLALLLGLQVVQGAQMITRAARRMPESRSAELAALLRRPDLARAIVIGDPDYNLEVLPFYVANPTYLVRERRFGRTTIFSRVAMRTVTPSDVIDAGRMLAARYRRPVVIVMSEPIFRTARPGGHPRGSYGATRQSAADLTRFARATRLLARFGPLREGDETYDVYALAPA